jgi:hypothetical protein
MSLTTGENESVTLSSERQTVCLEAAWELDALAELLPTLVPNIEEAHGAYHVVRGISARIRQLACAVMSGLHDGTEATKALRREVLVSEQIEKD